MILNTAILKKRLHGARIDQLADSNETAIIDDHIQSIGKVLFSQLFVCSQGVFFWGVGVWSEGWGGGFWSGWGSGQRQTPFLRWLLPRPVGILLECFLVLIFFGCNLHILLPM